MISDPGRQGADGKIRCFSCRHFQITHDKAFPYGCAAMGFKSRIIPSREVFASSGLQCQMFTPKRDNPL